ncbi:MAG: hypothetical protein HeimC2_39120 [Candidatus Heimdallarchaeota archaeon LC_2]|nr:MAG: hypothetical protein HeimC2_39120 [Candidatus Heimdallarchaeota archaeon LC_2]
MFIGHFATGLAFYVQKQGGKITFFLLVLGTQFVDILWGLFTLLGFEGGVSLGSVKHNFFDTPWSHSLLMMIVWSVIYGFAANYYVSINDKELNNFGIIAGLSVFSHWVLDFIVHNDDMRIIPTSDQTLPSLYLWEFPIATFIIEFAIIIGSWWLYWKVLKSKEEIISSTRPLLMIGLLSFLHLINFLPSFNDVEGMEVDAITGLAGFIGIVVIASIMTWIHPERKI